jgi:hypothetical protein
MVCHAEPVQQGRDGLAHHPGDFSAGVSSAEMQHGCCCLGHVSDGAEFDKEDTHALRWRGLALLLRDD